MEDLLRAAALGIVQGLTEFLPISSSGHLIITRELLGWEFANDLTFDVALHLGTTVALLVFFWREWLLMLRGGLRWAPARGPHPPAGLRLGGPSPLPPAHRGDPGRRGRPDLRQLGGGEGALAAGGRRHAADLWGRAVRRREPGPPPARHRQLRLARRPLDRLRTGGIAGSPRQI